MGDSSDDERGFLTSGQDRVDNNPTPSMFPIEDRLEYSGAEVLGSLKREGAFAGKQPWMANPRQASDEDESPDEEEACWSPITTKMINEQGEADVLKYLMLSGIPLDRQVQMLRSAASYLVASGLTSYKRPGPKKKQKVNQA